MSIYAEKMKKYCDEVLQKKVNAGVYEYKAVQRFVNDLKRSKDADFNFEYSQKDADILCSFAEALKPADLNGETITLLPWQIFCLCQLEGWRYKLEPTRKRFRTGYIEVNRKNGKTSGILEPMTLFNFIKYPASESYLVSSRDDLADKTFKEISAIIEADENLRSGCECRSLAITYENSRIGFFCDGGKSADGFRPRFACIDEFHEYATDQMLTSMMYGMRSKKDAQLVIITTADADINRPCYEQNIKSKRILNNLQTQEDFFCIIYAIDEGDDFHDPSVWRKANPSLYAIIEPDVIQSDIQDAELTPARIPELKAKTFGIWGGGGRKSWIPLEIFQKNKDVKIEIEDFENCPCCAALDLSNVDDFTAYTKMFLKDGIIYAFHKFYVPEEQLANKYKRENVNIYSWVDSGAIVATPGATVDYSFMIADIIEDTNKYQFMAIGYDKWQAHDVINGIEAERPEILLIEIEQSLKKLSPMTQAYEKTIRDGKLVDNSDVMAWMINNAEIRPDANGNYKPMKPSKTSTRRIDGVITSIMAHSLLFNPEVNTPPATMTFEELKALF